MVTITIRAQFSAACKIGVAIAEAVGRLSCQQNFQQKKNAETSNFSCAYTALAKWPYIKKVQHSYCTASRIFRRIGAVR